MTASLPSVDFRRIREHESSQQRAFEELGYILVPTVDGLPVGTRLVRRGTPDAGIEFSCTAPDGSGLWAWQAKFLFTFNDSAIQQMQDSAYEAMAHEKTLSRYTFIVPVDLPAGAATRGGRRLQSAMEKWDSAVARWEAEATRLGMRVKFDYIGHSALVAALTADLHAGHLRYFFDRMAFTEEFCANQVRREIKNLGDRYLPQVHVEIDLSSRFDALAQTSDFRDEVRGALVAVKSRSWLGVRAFDDDPTLTMRIGEVDAAGDALLEFGATSGSRMLEADDAVFTELTALADIAAQCADRAIEALREVRRSAAIVADELEKYDPVATVASSRCRTIDEVTSHLWPLLGCLRDVIAFVGNAVAGPVVLVSGVAGCGKSHMVADLAARRTRAGLPTLLLCGQQFSDSRGPWAQISEAIGVDLIPTDLLATLSAAAQSRRKGKALVIIDGLNEGAGVSYWRGVLPGFISTIREYPWVALVLTVRDTYRAGLLPNGELPLAAVRHPGLTGHEEEALAVYAAHYGLRVTDIPPLNPEMRNPLFLGSLCRSVKARGMDEIPREAASLTWVFDGLIQWVNSALADRLDYDDAQPIVRRAVNALATRMLETRSEALPVEVADEICHRFLPRQQAGLSQTLLHGLTVESILLREPVPRERNKGAEDAGQQVRFTYQRLSDHLRGEVILDRSPDLDSLRSELVALTTPPGVWERLGILEALSMLVPERHGIELMILFEQATPSSDDTWLRRNLAEHLINTLVWRTPTSISTTTIDLATRASADHEDLANTWLTVQISLACVADHPLNVDRLHDHLAPLGLIERDLSWSRDATYLWYDDDNAMARLINWTWSGRIETIAAETRRLAVQTLAWLLTSPNRQLRDSSTKALLRLVDGHTGVLADLAERFAEINDPYVTERISAIAYGHLLRHRHLGAAEVTVADVDRLARTCTVLNAHAEQSGHILQRWSSAQACDVANAMPARAGAAPTPVTPRTDDADTSWRLTAPTLDELAVAYGRAPSRYLFALSTFGHDFEKYVIRHACDRLIYAGQDSLLAERAEARTQRQETRRRNRAAQAATNTATAAATVARSLAALVETNMYAGELDGAENAALGVDSFMERRLAALRAAREQVPPDSPAVPEPERPDHHTVGRWIAQRVHDMGWTDQLFADVDRGLANLGRSDHERTERFGKKYAWIAFHEMLGLLTNHCLFMESWDETGIPYSGPWQFTGLRDIDPSDATRGDSPALRTSSPHRRAPVGADTAWWLRDYQIGVPEAGDNSHWLDDDSDIPQHLRLLTATDPFGEEWLALESHATWSLRYGTPELGHLVRQQWMRSQSYIIGIADLPKIKRWAPRQNWMGLWLPTPGDHPPGLLGEFPDLDPWTEYLADCTRHATGTPHEEEPDPDPNWSTFHVPQQLRTRMALTTACIGKCGSNDMSATALTNRIIPARLVLDLLDARWAPTAAADHVYRLGPDEHEMRWHAPNGLIAFTTFGRDEDHQETLWVKAQPFRAALADHGLAVWAWSLGEKVPWDDEHNASSERVDIYAAHQYAPGPPITWRSSALRT